jgi:hypothetical protein
MILKVDFKQFLDEKGDLLVLTEQATRVFTFLSKIVLSVSENIEQPLIEVDLNCNSRGTELSCDGSIEATCIALNKIEWHCDTCEASGTISNWKGSLWDMQKRTIH